MLDSISFGICVNLRGVKIPPGHVLYDRALHRSQARWLLDLHGTVKDVIIFRYLNALRVMLCPLTDVLLITVFTFLRFISGFIFTLHVFASRVV